MPCGPQMVGRRMPAAGPRRGAAPGIAHGRPCLGPGRVQSDETDRRRLRRLAGRLAWTAFALLASAATIALLSSR